MLYFSRNSTVSSNHFYSFTHPTFYIQLVYGTTTSKLIQLCKKRAQVNASQTNLKQEKEKNRKDQKRGILPVLKTASSFFWRSFRETVSALRIISLMALSSLASIFLFLSFLWTIAGVSLLWGVFDWIGCLDLSPLFLPLWTSTTIVLDAKVVIFSTTWTTIRKH